MEQAVDVASQLKIALPTDEIAAFCRRWRITELSVFGSVLRDDFRPESDVGFLVTFALEARTTLLDLVEMEEELAALLGRDVDIVSRRGVERSKNWIRRQAILGSADPIYVAG
jgi:predicted nucleotidyltransferase